MQNELKQILNQDSQNYPLYHKSYFKRLIYKLNSNPINDQSYIWKYIYTLRHCEYSQRKLSQIKKKRFSYFVRTIGVWYWKYKLRKVSYKTQIQIPPGVVGPGLTIWHWGPIIINPKSRIGENVVLNPGIVIGHKHENEGAPIIGNNVFIGAGSKIIGQIHIGDNVKIGQNVVIVKDIPSNTTIVSQVARIVNI